MRRTAREISWSKIISPLPYGAVSEDHHPEVGMHPDDVGGRAGEVGRHNPTAVGKRHVTGLDQRLEDAGHLMTLFRGRGGAWVAWVEAAWEPDKEQ